MEEMQRKEGGRKWKKWDSERRAEGSDGGRRQRQSKKPGKMAEKHWEEESDNVMVLEIQIEKEKA